jgi:hypothetical protein
LLEVVNTGDLDVDEPLAFEDDIKLIGSIALVEQNGRLWVALKLQMPTHLDELLALSANEFVNYADTW